MYYINFLKRSQGVYKDIAYDNMTVLLVRDVMSKHVDLKDGGSIDYIFGNDFKEVKLKSSTDYIIYAEQQIPVDILYDQYGKASRLFPLVDNNIEEGGKKAK